MIVVDTNVIVSMWVPNDKDEWVYKLLKKEPDWIAPVLWRSEFRNVLSLYLRKNLLDFPTALLAIEEAEQLMSDNEFEVHSPQIMSFVNNSTCSAYDCEFVALADDLGVPLLSFDKKIIREFPGIGVSPQEFLS